MTTTAGTLANWGRPNQPGRPATLRRATQAGSHPAATVLVLVAVAIALLVRKSFCSWV